MAKKHKDNFLDYVPIISERHDWEADAEGKVTIHMVHRGFYAAIAQRCFHRPRVSHIALDRNGSFVFRCIDGTRTVGQIALAVKSEFGADAEPLYDRLTQYLKILYNNGFIYFRGKDRQPK